MASLSEEVWESRLEDDAMREKRPRIESGDGGDKSVCEGGDDGDKSVCEGGDDDKLTSGNDDYSSDEEMPDELYNEYVTRLEESEGFDVPDVGRYLSCGMITPAIINDHTRTWVNPLAEMAIKQFNVKENANFEFVRLVNLTTTVIRGILCYITFEAKDAEGQIKTFQAQVIYFMDEHEVLFCRLKPPTTKNQGTGHEQVGQCPTCY